MIQKTNKPNLKNLLISLEENIFKNLNCILIGKILKFYPNKQSADIEIFYKRKIENKYSKTKKEKYIDYPVLYDVPVIFLGGKTASIQHPVNSGDFCIIFFNDKNLEKFLINETKEIANDYINHDFNNAIALVGIRSYKKPIQNFDNLAISLINNNTKIILKNKIKIANNAVNLLNAIQILIEGILGMKTSDGKTLVDTTGKVNQANSMFSNLLE